jgi:CheY-specific phosphatase CheX
MRAPTLTPIQVDDLIEQSAIEAAVGLFLSCSVSLDYADTTERAIISNIELCGVVGFLGRQISGTVLLAVTAEPLNSTNQFAVRGRDWMAELTNQLFGRIKNRLLRRGLQLAGTPPVVIGGEHLVTFTGRSSCQPIVLRTESGGRVCIWIDYAMQNALPLELSDGEPGVRVPNEGEILFF